MAARCLGLALLASTRAATGVGGSDRQPTLGVLAIFRDEAQIMHEWLLHYTAEGVCQFVLLDQESTDNGTRAALEFAEMHPQLDITVLPAVGNYQQAASRSPTRACVRSFPTPRRCRR